MVLVLALVLLGSVNFGAHIGSFLHCDVVFYTRLIKVSILAAQSLNSVLARYDCRLARFKSHQPFIQIPKPQQENPRHVQHAPPWTAPWSNPAFPLWQLWTWRLKLQKIFFLQKQVEKLGFGETKPWRALLEAQRCLELTRTNMKSAHNSPAASRGPPEIKPPKQANQPIQRQSPH